MTRSYSSESDTSLIAGPYVLHGYHSQIYKAAAPEKTRYALNSVALIPEIPGLVATDGHMMAVMPLQPIDDEGEIGAFGTGFKKKRKSEPILLPIEVFKGMPKKLGGGETHQELVVIERDEKLYVIRRGCPYGNVHEYHIPDELRHGQYPEYDAILDSVDNIGDKKADVVLDVDYLTRVAAAIGCSKAEARVTIFGNSRACLIKHANPQDAGPNGWAGAGIIMPITGIADRFSS